MARAERLAGHVVASAAADRHIHFHLPDSIKDMSPEQLAALTAGAQGAAAGAAAEAEEAAPADGGAEEAEEQGWIVAALRASGDADGLPTLGWEEIMEHSTAESLWVVVDGAVLDMTDFPEHPGGADIPAEYGGKDASEFWNSTHALLRNNLGMLQSRIVGLADGPPPAAAQGRTQPVQYTQQNWSGFVEWSHGLGDTMATPSSVEEVQEVVRGASKVRVLGRGYGFPAICDQSDPDGVMLSLLPNMSSVLDIDAESGTVTVEGGCTYRTLIDTLEGTGFALQNIQCPPQPTVAGGVATGSHGSSGMDPETGGARTLSSTADLVSALELVTADGELQHYTREDNAEIWDGLVTSVGLHGVVTKLALDLVPDFDIHNYGWARVPAEHFLEHWEDMLMHPDCDSFNAMVHHPFEFVAFGFQHFVPAGSLAQAPAVEATWYGEGETARVGNFGPFTLHGESGNNVVRWHEALTWLSDAKDAEFQVEIFVPLERAVDALRATWGMAAEYFGEVVDTATAVASGSAAGTGQLMNYHHVRVVKGNGQWLSPTSRDVLGIAFGLNKATPRERLLEEIGRAHPRTLSLPCPAGLSLLRIGACRVGGGVGAVRADIPHGQARHDVAAGLAGAVRREPGSLRGTGAAPRPHGQVHQRLHRGGAPDQLYHAYGLAPGS